MLVLPLSSVFLAIFSSFLLKQLQIVKSVSISVCKAILIYPVLITAFDSGFVECNLLIESSQYSKINTPLCYDTHFNIKSLYTVLEVQELHINTIKDKHNRITTVREGLESFIFVYRMVLHSSKIIQTAV